MTTPHAQDSARPPGHEGSSARWLGLAALVPALAVALHHARRGWPQPRVHDEFAHLLTADLFGHGVFAAPSPAAPDHLLAMHVMTEPVFASKFLLGQAGSLALGDALGGHPAVGLWIQAALLGGAMGWLADGFAAKPRYWLRACALLSSLWLMLGMHAAYWGASYWGGGLTAAGGALLFAAALRMLKRRGAGLAAAFVMGANLLLWTRPLEGAIAVVPVTLAVLLRRIRDDRPGIASRGEWLTAVVGLTLGFGLLLAQNMAITGEPLTLPYMVWEERYNSAPLVLWRELTPKVQPNEFYRRFFTEFVDPTFAAQAFSAPDALRKGWIELGLTHAETFAWPLSGFGVVGALMMRAKGPHRSIWIGLVLLLIWQLLCPWKQPHYLAAIAGPVWLAVAIGVAHMGERLLPSQNAQRRAAWALLLFGLLFIASRERGIVRVAERGSGEHLERARLDAALHALPGRDLVVVDVGVKHSTDVDWVANGGWPERQPVVWARELGADRDAELLAAYPGRWIWRLRLGEGPPELRLDPNSVPPLAAQLPRP